MRGLPDVGDAFGEYDITGVLGRGGMGVVYTASKRRLVRTEALKVLSPSWVEEADYRNRFLREAEILATLDSPHIIHIYDYGDVDGTPFISTQLIRGGDLSDYIRDKGPLPAGLALEIASQVASALEDAHGSGVIHRDVKPSNVLLRQETEPFVYLCDFGIARAESGGLTTTGTVVGTWAYLAPERCNGREASVASDIYSVGCLLWAMLTGHAPYQGTDVAVAMAHLHDPVPQLDPVDDPSGWINGLLTMALAKAPEDRFLSAAALRTALEGAASAEAHREAPARRAPAGRAELTEVRRPTPPLSASPPPSRQQQPAPDRRRLGVAAVLAVALAVVLAVGIGVVLLSRGARDTGASSTSTTRSPTHGRSATARLRRLTRVSYNGGARSQVAVQSFDSGPGNVHVFGLDGARRMVSSGWALPKPRNPNDQNGRYPIHRMNGDFDGDHKTDAAFVDEDASGDEVVSVARSTGNGFADPVAWGTIRAVPSNGFIPVTGDFDGNGMMDVGFTRTVQAHTSVQVFVMLSDGRQFAAPQPWSSVQQWDDHFLKAEPGDVNGDGRTDLVAFVGTKDNDRPVQVLAMVSDGHGFTTPSAWLTGRLPTQNLGEIKPVLGDFDGDHRTDAMVYTVAPQGGSETVLLRSDGTGFTPERSPWWSGDFPVGYTWVSVGDFDGDGRPDVGLIMSAGADGGAGGGVDVRVLLSRQRRLQLSPAVGNWPDYDIKQTRTLNVIG